MREAVEALCETRFRRWDKMPEDVKEARREQARVELDAALAFDVGKGDWIDFLSWLVSDHGFSAPDIIAVVEKPWKYEAEYADYLAAGGIERE